MDNYNLTKMATQMFFPGNIAQLDDAGLPSILVYIPAFKLSDVLTGGDDSTHPAFIVNGKEIPGFYYSKYQNVVHNGAAYSLPAEDPQTGITFDAALAVCEAKGAGWHLSTAAEWAAIALWCKANGFLPYGNNDQGKDKREGGYKAIPTQYHTNGLTSNVATGTGPMLWSHNGDMSGIWDMNGNVWEWQGGVRCVWGEIQIFSNNDAANQENPQNKQSTCWKAINATSGALVDPECSPTATPAKLSGNTVRIDFVDGAWKYSTNVSSPSDEARTCTFGKLTCTAEIGAAAILLLRALALLPDEGTTAADYDNCTTMCNNSNPEQCLSRGGVWYMGSQAGVFHFNMACTREAVANVYGFRAAYIPEIGQEG